MKQPLLHRKILYLFLFLTAIIVVLAAAIFYMYRQAEFSKEVLSLQVSGALEAAIGQEIRYTVKYSNSGNFTLEKLKLVFELPQHSLTEDGKLLIQQNLADLPPGHKNEVVFTARLLGREGDIKTARARLSYIPHNLSARYESETALSTRISSVPLALAYQMPSYAVAGSEFEYYVDYSSAIDYPLENMSLKIEPVVGFTVVWANPSSLDKIEWKLPTLNAHEGGRINVRGLVDATPPESLKFSMKLGMWQNGAFVVVKEATHQIDIDAPDS